MREQVELGQQPDLARDPQAAGSSGLRLLEPWAPEVALGWPGGDAWEDRSAQTENAERHLVLAGVAEAEVERPSAMVVMRQLLDAWRSAERELAAVAETNPERAQFEAHAATLRSLYQGLFARVQGGRAERTRV